MDFLRKGEIREIFLSRKSCVTVPKSFVEEYSVICFRMFPKGKKFVHKRARKKQIFPLNVFSPTVPKMFVEEPFSVSLISVIKKLYALE